MLTMFILPGCITRKHLVGINDDEKNPVVWEIDDNSIRVSGRVRFFFRPYYKNRAAMIRLKIRIRNPDQIIEFASEYIQIYCRNKEYLTKRKIKIEENTLNNEALKSSRRSTFQILGTITEEVFLAEPHYDEYLVKLPDLLFHQDTISLEPVSFYSTHWLDRVLKVGHYAGEAD